MLVGSNVGGRGWCRVNAKKGSRLVRLGVGGGVQVGYEPKIELIVRMQKRKSGCGGGGGVRFHI